MGISYKKYITVSTLTIFLVLGIFAFLYDRSVKQNILLQNELRDFIVLPISFHNKLYTVEKGAVKFEGEAVSVFVSERVLRVAYASALNRFDPIFGIEGTDADMLEKSVADLDASVKRTASLYGKDDEMLIREDLHPIAFLKQLSETEKARQALLFAASSQNAAGYYKNLDNLIRLNMSYAKRLAAAYRGYYTDRLNVKYNFFDGYGTTNTYGLALEGAVSEMNKRTAELKKREACLSHYSFTCPSLKGALGKLSAAGERSDVRYEPLTADVADNISLMRAYLQSFSALDASFARENNPLIALDRSDCFTGAKTIYYQSWLKSDSRNNGFFTIHFVNDLYFTDVSKLSNEHKVFLRETGLDYLYQPATNLYICQSMESDFSRAIAMDTLYHLLSEGPVMADDRLKKLAPDMYDLENKITTGDTLYESEFDSYIGGLQSLLTEYGETGLSEIIGPEKVVYIEKLLSIARQKMPRFDEIIRFAISNNAIIAAFIKNGIGVPVRFLLISRGYPSLLLLSYNKSAYENPLRLTREMPFDLTYFRLVSANQFLKEKYGEQRILEMMQRGEKFLREQKN